jgi:alginate O-acetyltransferase complex protein AlgI
VYRRAHKPLTNFWDYQLYIILFPKLIAGPITRYHEIADQINDRSANETLDNRLTGFYRFVIGLSKKMLIANVMGQQADIVFGMHSWEISTYTVWIGALAYTFQIYFDFSGYSDMTIGLSKMIGFKLPENFNNPYISQSITEFWRRWHITLSNWMKNYLYIPLGGSRVASKSRMYFNLWIVFLASGLWYGASWNFIIWSAYNGTFLVLEKLFLLKLYDKLGKVFRVVITFIIVVVGGVFFRANILTQACAYLKSMFLFKSQNTIAYSNQFVPISVIACFFSFITFF